MGEKESDKLIAFGGEVKAQGDGRVGGWLVKFTDSDHPDLAQDYFDATTDYDAGVGDEITTYYHHGLDPKMRLKKLSSKAQIKAIDDEVGIWVETQLDLRDKWERAIYGMAKADKLGWSSGTAGHLVERVKSGRSYHLKTWPLGSDASLTPTPMSGGETPIMTMKAWQEQNPNPEGLRPEESGNDSESGSEEVKGATGKENEKEKGRKEMGEEILTPDAVKAQIDAALTAERERVAAETKAAAERQAEVDKAVADAKKAWEKEAGIQNDSGFAGKGVNIADNGDIWRYDNVETGDLAVVADVLASAQKSTYRQVNPLMVKALAMRMDSKESLGQEPLRRAHRYMKSAGIKADETNFSTNASYGDEWIGVAYSGVLWEAIRVGTFVVDKLNPIEFPAGAESMILPLEGTDPVWYTVAQAGDAASSTAQVTNTVPAKALGTARVTMTLGKLGSSTIWTGEMTEDAVLPFASQLKTQIGKSGAEYLESAVIDGDTEAGANTNINDIAGTPAATDWFMVFNGFRKSALVTTTANSRDGGVLTTGDFLETLKLQGAAKINAVDKTKVSFIIDPSVHWKALELPDVKTRDVFSGATLENGTLVGIFGYEVNVSGSMNKASAARLSNTAGKVDVDTVANNAKGSIVAPRWDQWQFGFRRRMTQEVERIPRADAWEITSMLRAGLIQRDAEAVSVSYNLTV